MSAEPLHVYPLGQVGYLFEYAGLRVVVDPYLGDSVAEQFGASLKRTCAPTLSAEEMTGVSVILLTHAHLDHTDPGSLAAILERSPSARVYAPYECHPVLAQLGLPVSMRKLVSAGDAFEIDSHVHVRVVPAAHTELETNAEGQSRYVGYLIKFGERVLYHAGDTVPHPAIFESLAGEKIEFAFLPVNERNFFRSEAGIVGNMTPREAFLMACRLGAKTLVPTHWDLFAPNSTFPWEIEQLHQKTAPEVGLRFLPCGQAYRL